jgi:hypothetical protein
LAYPAEGNDHETDPQHSRCQPQRNRHPGNAGRLRTGHPHRGIYSNEDRFALHRFKADESYLVGDGKKPIGAYLDIADIIRVATLAKVDAIHPGYGFLSENPDFAEACAAAGIAFIGPRPEVMRELGNKVAARALAERVGVPVVPATGAAAMTWSLASKRPGQVGYPLMLKASWGGGGRGMRAINNEDELAPAIEVARREAAGRLRQRRGVSGKDGGARPPRRSAGAGRLPRPTRAPVRARLLGAAPQPESRRTRAGALSRRATRQALCASALQARRRPPITPTPAPSNS